MKKKPKRAGRPTSLNATLSRKLCALLAEAYPIKASCEACGVSEASYHTWVSRGEAGEKPFSEFLASTTRARAQARIRLVKEIKRCSRNDWRGWAWIAERMFPSEFARSEPRTIVVERSLVPVSPSEPPLPRTTTYWTTTGNEIPFTKEQLAYMAEMRSRYAPPDKDRNGEK